MFFAPKEIKTETGESLVYNLHRTMVSKEFTFDAAHHLFNYEGKCKSLHGHTYHLQKMCIRDSSGRVLILLNKIRLSRLSHVFLLTILKILSIKK